MSKRKEDIVRFIQSVSPKKKTKAFNLRIPTDGIGKVQRAICYDDSKNQTFQQKSLSSEPVKISDCIIQDQGENKAFAKYVTNKSSSISELTPLQVGFDFFSSPLEWLNLENDPEVGTFVNIKGVVDISHATEKSVTVRSGRPSSVMNGAFIVNEEGTIELTLWDEWILTIKNHIMEKENKFKFKNLLVKEFNNTVHL